MGAEHCPITVPTVVYCPSLLLKIAWKKHRIWHCVLAFQTTWHIITRWHLREGTIKRDTMRAAGTCDGLERAFFITLPKTIMNVSVLKKRQFMASITICDLRVIKGEVAIFGNWLPKAAAKRMAIQQLKKERYLPETFACLCETSGRYYRGRKLYNTGEDDDFGTRVHEDFHAEVATLRIPSVGKWTDPIEESAAYAYMDFMMLGKEPVKTQYSMRVNSKYAKHSVRFVVATDNSELSRMRANAIGIFERTKTMLAGDNLALAFSYAENFICYLECLAVLRRWGETDGKKILFDAIRESEHLGPENARQFLLARLPAIVQEDITEGYGIDPAKLRLRPIHHHDYTEEERILK